MGMASRCRPGVWKNHRRTTDGSCPTRVSRFREMLPDGMEFKAVWSILQQSGVAKLVTVHFFD